MVFKLLRWLGRSLGPCFGFGGLDRSPAALQEATPASEAIKGFSAAALEEATPASEASSAAEALAAVPAEVIEEASSAAKSLAEVPAAAIQEASSAAEAIEGVPSAALEAELGEISAASIKEVSTSEVWELGDSSASLELEVCGSASRGDLPPPVQVLGIACMPTGMQFLLNRSGKHYISTCDPHQSTILNSCHKLLGLVAGYVFRTLFQVARSITSGGTRKALIGGSGACRISSGGDLEEATPAAEALAEASSAAEGLAVVAEVVIEEIPEAAVLLEEIDIGLGKSLAALELEVCGSTSPGGGDLPPSVQVQVIACLPTGLQFLLDKSCKLYISTCDPHQSTVLKSCHKQFCQELRAFLQRASVDLVFPKSHMQNECEELGTQIQRLSAAAVVYCLTNKEKQYLPALGALKYKLDDNNSHTMPNFELKAKHFIDYGGTDLSLVLFWEHTNPQFISVPRSNNYSGHQIALKDVILNQSSIIIVGVTLQLLMNGKFWSVKPKFKTRITIIYFVGLHLTVGIVLPVKTMVEHHLYRVLIREEYSRAALTSRLAGGAAKIRRTANGSLEAEFYGGPISTLKYVQRVSERGAALVIKGSNNVDVIKKTLASKQAEKTTHKMEKNAATLERSNHETVCSSPYPRWLMTFGNRNTSKSRMPINLNGRMILNSPLSRPNLAIEYMSIHLLKSSVEDAESATTNLRKFGSLALKVQYGAPQEKNPFPNQNLSRNAKIRINVRAVQDSTSKVHSKISEGESSKENTRCPEVISHDDLRLMGNTNARRPNVAAEHGSVRLLRLSLEDANCGRKLEKSESRNSNVPSKTFEEVSKEVKKYCPKVILEDDPNAICNKTFYDKDLNPFSPGAYNSSYRGPLSKTTRSYGVHNRQSKIVYWSRKPERVVSSDETSFSNKSLQIIDYDQESRLSRMEQPLKNTQLLVRPLDVLPDGSTEVLRRDNGSREAESYGETYNSMKFAQRASTVEFCASRVKNGSTDAPELELEKLVTTKSASSANYLTGGQWKHVPLAAGSSKDLNTEAMQLSNGAMGPTELLAEIDMSHELDSVPVRTVSRSLIKQIEALNMKARRVKAQNLNAQGRCDEKGKCLEVANGRDNSSEIIFHDAERAKELQKEEEESRVGQRAKELQEEEESRGRQRVKELREEGEERRARQRAEELREEEEERKRAQKARAMMLEEFSQRDVPDQSKEQQVHHTYAKGSLNKGKMINARDQRQRIYCVQSSEISRGIDIDRRLDARSNRMPSGKTTVGALPGSMPPRTSEKAVGTPPIRPGQSTSVWIERTMGQTAPIPPIRPPRSTSVWIEKTMGRTVPIFPPRTKSIWIEKKRNL